MNRQGKHTPDVGFRACCEFGLAQRGKLLRLHFPAASSVGQFQSLR